MNTLDMATVIVLGLSAAVLIVALIKLRQQ